MTSTNLAGLYEAFHVQKDGESSAHDSEEHQCPIYLDRIADRIVQDIKPQTVLHAGCGSGLLVQALRQRGVEAWGLAPTQAPSLDDLPSVQPYCFAARVSEPFPKKYDLVICLQVLEHFHFEEIDRAIANLCRHATDILFSSISLDAKEAALVQAQAPEEWTEHFARYGFFRDINYNTSYIPGWAVRVRKIHYSTSRLVKDYERHLWQLEKQGRAARQFAMEQKHQLSLSKGSLIELHEELDLKAKLIEDLKNDNFKLVSALRRELPAKTRLIRHLNGEKTKAIKDIEDEMLRQRHLVRDKDRLVQELLAEKRTLEQFWKLAVEQKERSVQELHLRQQTIEQELRHTQIGQAEMVFALSTAKERAVHTLTAELAWKDQAMDSMITEKEKAAQILRNDLANIRRSRAWWLAESMSWIRWHLFPRGCFCERLIELGRRGTRIWRTEGTKSFCIRGYRKVRRKFGSFGQPGNGEKATNPRLPTNWAIIPKPNATAEPLLSAYENWIRKHEPNEAALDQQRRTLFAHSPKISIVVPTYNTPDMFLREMIESVMSQTYENWELCIADGSEAEHPVKIALREYAAEDDRIRVEFLPENRGIAGNSNAALALATGEYVALLDHDDTLAPFALYEIVKSINANPKIDFLYSDEDKIDITGQNRSDPHFKPDWSPDTLRSHNYICHLSVFRNDLITQIGGFHSGFDGSQDYDLILRATEKARKITHVPKVLYHWRIHQGSVASGAEVKMYAYDSAKKALREHLIRTGVEAEVRDGITLGVYQVNFAVKQQPLISVIIPNHDNQEYLQRCIDSLCQSKYAPYEIMVVENNSREPSTFAYYDELQKQSNVRVLKWHGAFNYSAVNNFAVAQAQGEVLLLLNNDIEAINPDWLERMLEHVLRSDVGAVGAKLYYPDNTVQHGGVVVGLGGIAGHAHHWFPRGAFGYFGRLIITQNLSAVTAACLMTKRKVFDEVGGFDERFQLAFNDVDFCVKIRRKGYLIVWTPFAELYHWESKTRGQDTTPEKQARFQGEVQLFAEKWFELLHSGDPYYNPNLTLQLPDFSLRIQELGPIERLESIGCKCLPLDRLRAA